jgi:hypothetical protein
MCCGSILRALGHLDDRQRRLRGEQGGERALVLRREVLHEHDGHVDVRGQMLEQLRERLEAAGRGANPDDHRGVWTRCDDVGRRHAVE